MHQRSVTFRTDRFESRTPQDFNLWRRFTHRPRAEDLDRVASAVDARLRSDPAIREIGWWDGEPFRGVSRDHP